MRIKSTQVIAGMMMLAAILLVWNRSAHAALEVIEDAIEASLRDVTLPVRDFGNLVVRECPGCSPVILRTDAATRFQLLGTPRDLTREEFLARAAEARDDGMIGIFHVPGGDRVTRLVLAAPEPR